MEIALFILFVGLVFVFKAVKVVPQQHSWVVERLGKFHAALLPGLNIVVPFVDRIAYRHMLKEVPLDVPSQVCITKDNTQLQVDGVLYFQVTDPAITSPLLRSWRKPRCVRPSVKWNLIKPSKSANTSIRQWLRLWMRRRRAGVSKCCVTRLKI